MNNPLPKVSIIIPVYNGANYMREAIDSALAQSYENIEIIVVNDGSTDDGETDRIARSYGDKIRYFAKENGGVSTALNLAIGEMTGDYFSWLSHDDLYYPNKIKKQIDYLAQNGGFSQKTILYSNVDVIDEQGNITNTTGFQLYEPNLRPEYAVLHGLISGITLLIPAGAFRRFGNFDVRYRCIQDYLLFYHFLEEYNYHFMSDVLAASRVHDRQVTNVSPKLMEENYYLWTMMAEQLPLEKKVRLEGSEYAFFYSMYLHIQKFYPYEDAANFCKTKAEECLVKCTAILDEYSAGEIIAACQAFARGEEICDAKLRTALMGIGLEKISFYLENSGKATKSQLKSMAALVAQNKGTSPSPSLVAKAKFYMDKLLSRRR